VDISGAERKWKEEEEEEEEEEHRRDYKPAIIAGSCESISGTKKTFLPFTV
jgi:hypothetical protein